MTCARSRKEEKEHLSMIEVSGCMNLLKIQRLKPSFHITHTLSFTEGGPGAMPSKREGRKIRLVQEAEEKMLQMIKQRKAKSEKRSKRRKERPNRNSRSTNRNVGKRRRGNAPRPRKKRRRSTVEMIGALKLSSN